MDLKRTCMVKKAMKKDNRWAFKMLINNHGNEFNLLNI